MAAQPRSPGGRTAIQREKAQSENIFQCLKGWVQGCPTGGPPPSGSPIYDSKKHRGWQLMPVTCAKYRFPMLAHLCFLCGLEQVTETPWSRAKAAPPSRGCCENSQSLCKAQSGPGTSPPGSVRHKHWFVGAHGKPWRNVHALKSRGKQNYLPFLIMGFLLGKMMVKPNG